nr:hypothetical protein CFP56_16765 [Quercus suber]
MIRGTSHENLLGVRRVSIGFGVLLSVRRRAKPAVGGSSSANDSATSSRGNLGSRDVETMHPDLEIQQGRNAPKSSIHIGPTPKHLQMSCSQQCLNAYAKVRQTRCGSPFADPTAAVHCDID